MVRDGAIIFKIELEVLEKEGLTQEYKYDFGIDKIILVSPNYEVDEI